LSSPETISGHRPFYFLKTTKQRLIIHTPITISGHSSWYLESMLEINRALFSPIERYALTTENHTHTHTHISALLLINNWTSIHTAMNNTGVAISLSDERRA
jgi:hypothetical protein